MITASEARRLVENHARHKYNLMVNDLSANIRRAASDGKSSVSFVIERRFLDEFRHHIYSCVSEDGARYHLQVVGLSTEIPCGVHISW